MVRYWWNKKRQSLCQNEYGLKNEYGQEIPQSHTADREEEPQNINSNKTSDN